MSAINDGGPAFPAEGPSAGQLDNPGMSLRDYFAAKAMAAQIGTAAAPALGGLDGFEPHAAKAAYRMADAMLAARVQGGQP